MAYRTARETRRSHHHALAAATAAYHEEHHKALAVPLEAAARINEMIASAINVDPKWFWKNVPS